MAILRRTDQKRTSNRPGASSYRLAGPETGSKMLTISDITLEPGAEIAYHSHPNSEASHYVVSGKLECLLDGRRMTISEGDLALAPTGVGHGFANRSDKLARFIAMMPTTEPGRDQEDDSHIRDVAGSEDLPLGAALRNRVQAWTPWEGCLRYDMATADFGSTSTAFSELIFKPGAVAPPHYHPATEEAMFCLSGNLMAMYDFEEIPLAPGDVFLGEPGIPHTIFNASEETGVLLPIHPTLVPERVSVDWTPKTPLPSG